MLKSKTAHTATLLLLALLVSACGRKGPLFMPPVQAPAVNAPTEPKPAIPEPLVPNQPEFKQ